MKTEPSGEYFATLRIIMGLFAILGIGQLIAFVLGPVAVRLFDSELSTSIAPLVSTAIRNTVGIAILLVLLVKGVIPSLAYTEQPYSKEVQNKTRWTIKWYLILSGIIIVILILIQVLIFQPGNVDTTTAYDQFLTDIRVQIYFTILATIFAPIFEELLFRRYLISQLMDRGFSPAYAISFSAILFALSHTVGDISSGSTTVALFRIVATTAIGIILGLVYVKTKHVIFPILFHALNNGISAGVSFSPVLGQQYPILLTTITILFILIYVVALLYALVLLARNWKDYREWIGQFRSDMTLLKTREKRRMLIIGIFGLTLLPLIVISFTVGTDLSVSSSIAIYWLLVTVTSLLVLGWTYFRENNPNSETRQATV